MYGFNGADPTLLDRLPDILRGTRVIRLDENHRCTPQIVAVATAVLQQDDRLGALNVELPITTRVDGPVPAVIVHRSNADEAAWAARRARHVAHTGSQVVEHRRADPRRTRNWRSCRPPWRPNVCPLWWPAPTSGPPAICGARGAAPDADEDGSDEVTIDRDRVVLSTFHRAKGLQWPTVLVLGLSAGLMPLATAQTPDAIDEERRLFYVALTRAEEELWCSWSEAETVERDNLRQPSPWLAPIERTIAKLTAEAAPTAATEVSARVAELRRRLESGGGANR